MAKTRGPMVKATTIHLLVPVFACLWISATAHALLPPKEISRLNLAAKLIVVGEVTETGTILLPDKARSADPAKTLSVVKVLHVVKGYGIIEQGATVRIISRRPRQDRNRISAKAAGDLFVQVKVGDLVVAYLDPSEHPGFHQPVAGGASVAVIELSRPGKIQQDPVTQ